MIIRGLEIERFRAFENVEFSLGKRITAISGRNATQKTTLLGMIGQPFTISKGHPMYGCKTIDGYNFRSQFKEKFKISPEHDIIGQHKWKLNLHNGIYKQNYFVVESIARRQSDQDPTLRFWNAESRARGAGYIQLPVYFLSLSRLFPIGESGKTQKVNFTLTADELEYCLENYRTILVIHHQGENSSVGIEKGSSKTFAGISDDIHDIFTNSAGEGNIMRIILAVLSFKRLKEQYGKNYKGGILLIDELDATLYGFSQAKLVDYLWKSAEEFKIQIVFTTHSPIILKCVNKYQRRERHDRGIDLPNYAYDSSIVYLEPQYDEKGKRMVIPKNICTSEDLNWIINDMNLSVPISNGKLNVYCEDERAIAFIKHVLSSALNINLDLYMSFIDIDLGWTNYIQLADKQVPEFRNNIIVLDGDVPKLLEYCNSKEHSEHSRKQIVNEAGNFVFLPLVIEKDLFVLLKDYGAFSRFQKSFSRVSRFSYDICFNNWPLEAEKDKEKNKKGYKTSDFKQWYAQTEQILGDQTILFDFWCSKHPSETDKFVEEFIDVFNKVAERNSVDTIPQPQQEELQCEYENVDTHTD